MVEDLLQRRRLRQAGRLSGAGARQRGRLRRVRRLCLLLLLRRGGRGRYGVRRKRLGCRLLRMLRGLPLAPGQLDAVGGGVEPPVGHKRGGLGGVGAVAGSHLQGGWGK